MSMGALVFKEKAAGRSQVYAHLEACDKNYIPYLSKKVDLQEYSGKIVDNAITFEAWSNDRVIGLVAAYFNNADEGIVYITNVSVTGEFSNKGIATELMKMCLKKAKSLNFDELILEVSKKQNNAIRLYNKFGFQEFDAKEEKILMRLSIGSGESYE